MLKFNSNLALTTPYLGGRDEAPADRVRQERRHRNVLQVHEDADKEGTERAPPPFLVPIPSWQAQRAPGENNA